MLLDYRRIFGSSALLTLLLPALASAQEPAAVAVAEPEPEEAPPAVTLSLFADTYVSYNSSQTGSPVPYHRAYDNNTPPDPVTQFPDPPGFANRSLFGLSFVGLDANFDAGTVGATAFLRFGPSVPIFYATDTGIAGIDSMLGGYVTIKPIEPLVIDAGYFGTIYGAEVAESWINMNYTRGGLYYAMQPFYHFGVKASYAVTDMVTLRGMVVNGANNIVDENDAPALGLQLALGGLGGVFDLAAGVFYETGNDSSWGIETFFDVVATLTLGDFKLLANFDYNINRADDDAAPGEEGSEDVSYYGMMATAGYALTPEVGIALRGEYLVDPDNTVWTPVAGGTATDDTMNVITLTGTLDLKLLPHLVMRPEFRYETAKSEIYTDRDGGPTDGWYTAILGLVATSN
jgi:hypothetical protein